jgi:hypothetical protein
MGDLRGGRRFNRQAGLTLGLWIVGVFAISFVPLPTAVWQSILGIGYVGIGAWIWLYAVDYLRTARQRAVSRRKTISQDVNHRGRWDAVRWLGALAFCFLGVSTVVVALLGT